MTRQRRRFNQLIELWCRQGIDADEIQNRIEFIQCISCIVTLNI